MKQYNNIAHYLNLPHFFLCFPHLLHQCAWPQRTRSSVFLTMRTNSCSCDIPKHKMFGIQHIIKRIYVKKSRSQEYECKALKHCPVILF